MPRPRTGVIEEYGGGAVYVKTHPSRPGFFKVCYRDAGGHPQEDVRKGEEAALKWGAEIGMRIGVPSGNDRVWALVHHMLKVEVPANWSRGYVDQQESFPRTWLAKVLELPCNQLRQNQVGQSSAASGQKAGRRRPSGRSACSSTGSVATSAPANAPAQVDPPGVVPLLADRRSHHWRNPWSHDWRKDGPMLLAEPAPRRAHLTGGRHVPTLQSPRTRGSSPRLVATPRHFVERDGADTKTRRSCSEGV